MLTESTSISHSSQFTSTTAPGTIFSSREELAQHYKSDWHKYNLKRREANLPMLTLSDFQARFDAAMAIRREKESRDRKSGTDHLKKQHTNDKSTSAQNNKILGIAKDLNISSQTLSNNREEKDSVQEMKAQIESEELEEEPETIDPTLCLFDRHESRTVQDNVQYMYDKYGFFLPDREYLVDLEGLVGYCHEKIQIGHVCLYCQKIFATSQSCKQHMIQTRHTMLRYQAGIDLDEFEVFYDFTPDNEEFRKHLGKKNIDSGKKDLKEEKNRMETEYLHETEEEQEINDDDDDNEWEDIDDEEDEGDLAEADEEMYDAYEDELAKFGFEVTSLGELIFPNGKIIGHRGLSIYYKQRLRTTNTSAAVLAAKVAHSERLYKGRVYQLQSSQNVARSEGVGTSSSAIILSKAGLNMTSTMGRAGAGILVPSNNSSSIVSGRFNFTALSLYRFQAVMKKARKDEFRARRLEQRTRLPINKMDKKANRMFNNISIAHCRD